MYRWTPLNPWLFLAAVVLTALLCIIAAGAPIEGGAVGPGGVEVTCDIPVELRLKNTGGRDGAGLCVFTSIEIAGRYQNVTELEGFQAKMKREPGGGYPQKVDVMMKRYAPGVRYVQHTGGDLDFLRECLATGRPVCITYAGYDPHYRGKIYHMVDCVHIGAKSTDLATILDNNYIGERQLVWMTVAELEKRWLDASGGWAICLLSPAPPPPVKVR